MTRARPTSRGEDEERLTPSDRQRAAIGARLRDLRRRAGLTQTALAEQLGVTQSMVSKLEIARDLPTVDVIRRLTAVLGLSPEVEDELLGQLAALSVEVNTLRVLRHRGARGVQRWVGRREAAAETVWSFHPVFVPGLLQVPDYTAAILPLVLPSTRSEDPETVAGRQERQRILFDESRRFRFLVAEAALRDRVARPHVLRAQVRRLIGLAEGFDHIEIRILALGATVGRRATVGFDIRGDLVAVELQTDEVAYRDPDTVELYRELFEALWEAAVHGPAVVQLLRDVDGWLTSLADEVT